VRVESDSATEHDEAEVAEEATAQTDPDNSDAAQTGDDKDALGSKDLGESEEKSAGAADAEDSEGAQPKGLKRRIKWSRVVAFSVLPILPLVIAGAAGYLKWQDAWVRGSGVAGIESVAAAKDSTVAILSYQPDSVEKDLGAARDRLTGKFKDSYSQLIHDVVIPGAKKDHIAAIATVPAASSVSATPNHAVALVFVNQTVTVGNDAPTDTASAVRVTLDKSGGHWLISAFDPI
jgi:Mce-associated membrane protein